MCLAEIRAASSSSAGLPEPQSGEKLLLALEPRADQDAGLVWIADHFLHDAIAALAVGVGDPHTEGVLRERLQARLEVAALLIERSFAFPARTLQRMRAGRATVFPAVPTVYATLI